MIPKATVSIVKDCLSLHIIRHVHYPNLRNAYLDKEDKHPNVQHGAWHDAAVIQGMRQQGKGHDKLLKGEGKECT